MEDDERPQIHIHTDHNADDIRTFYEIPRVIAEAIQPEGESRTFAQCLADLVARNQHGAD